MPSLSRRALAALSIAVRRWIRRQRTLRAERRQRTAAARHQAAVAYLEAQWHRKNWWRHEPVEGWLVGYTCNGLPPEAHAHVREHGRIVPPTRAEIHRDLGL